ncbi:MAG: GtrA family protein [Prevotellaceae bacterium]|jgi:putative flippase GtrA|nr:GtrA family protein [Prevotellaceae bacterium]
MIAAFIKFCIVGGSGVVVDFTVTYACKEQVRMNKYLANALGFIVAASANYTLNRLWTFRSHNSIPAEYVKFIAIALVGLAINSGVIYLLVEKLKIHFYLSKLLAIGVATVWNFFMSYFFAFAAGA